MELNATGCMHGGLLVFAAALFSSCADSAGQNQVLSESMHHLRHGAKPEWDEFPVQTDGDQLTLDFEVADPAGNQTLHFVQQDVRRSWRVLVNDQEVGTLLEDEKKIHHYVNVPETTLRRGANTLRIEQNDTIADDIIIGGFILERRNGHEVLNEALVTLDVVEKITNTALPSRITIVDRMDRSLQTVDGARSSNLAIRPGCVYTADGTATFGLPAGDYTLYATRGFEYGVDSMQIHVTQGDRIRQQLSIAREVPTEGWIATDTHIHTFTYSGHGDATVMERVITLAGEGIEMPVMTDHNAHVDIRAAADSAHVLSWFTPVTGNEYTTPVGHFNYFPVTPGTPVPDYHVTDWGAVENQLRQVAGAKVIILNHARDLHNGFIPFGPGHHNPVSGESNEDWPFPANAMEVINSSAQRQDIMGLFNDWFAMLNRGGPLTPVGSSDCHDVARYLVGQGRTYVKGNDNYPGRIDVDKATANFLQGRVMVSYGLAVGLVINEQFEPGDIVRSASDTLDVQVTVLGPSWTMASHVALYMNGIPIGEDQITDNGTAGIKWRRTWRIPAGRRDAYFVAIAEGPDPGRVYWQIPKPYQPTGTQWIPKVIGSSGAVWVDADRDGKPTTAYDYARRLVDEAHGDLKLLIQRASSYDRTVIIQIASLLNRAGVDLRSPGLSRLVESSGGQIRESFDAFLAELDRTRAGD